MPQPWEILLKITKSIVRHNVHNFVGTLATVKHICAAYYDLAFMGMTFTFFSRIFLLFFNHKLIPYEVRTTNMHCDTFPDKYPTMK